MLRSKKNKIFLLALSSFALVGCGKETTKLPIDYDDPLFDKVPEGDPIFGNKNEDYYGSVSSSQDIYQKAANQILLDISKVAHGYGDDTITNHDVATVVADNFKGSVADAFDSNTEKASENLSSRAKESIVSTVGGGTYSKDNLFYESKYAQYLNENYFYLNFSKENIDTTYNKGQFITPNAKFEDLFHEEDENYVKYMEKELYNDIRINYLTTEYIYQNSRASIGNSNARKVQIVALQDRSDVPGAAKTLLNAYIDAYVKEVPGCDKISGVDSDPDFSLLSKLWKGITPEIADKYGDRYKDSEGNYLDVVLTAEEVDWLRKNSVLPSDPKNDAIASNTLSGKVLSDEKKLKAGEDDINRVDTSLESTYTGSYTYPYQTGVRKAFDDIAKSDIVTDGIYLAADGITGIPTDLSNRIFSPKISTKKSDVDEMKANPNKKKDITMYGVDGYRYLTIADTLNGTNDDIIYYDADSKTYYVTRILDVVDTAALSASATNTIYDTAEKKEFISRQVAYAMSTTGSYKTNAAVYWLSRTKINYSDEDFLEYMKTTYQDVFKADNPYTPKEDKDWIVLGEDK